MKYKQGDILYTKEGNEYYVSKILRVDEVYGIYHVRSYVPFDREPTVSDLSQLKVFIGHSPLAEFPEAVVLANETVKGSELEGYLIYLRYTNFPEYLRETGQEPKEIVGAASDLFNKAYAITEEGKYEEAIELYSQAFDIFPLFYEALDNRAFVKMDMGRWQEAIEDFKISLSIYPESELAEFSIGECYLRLENYAQAKEQFEKALLINPDHELSKEFLQKVADLSRE